MKVDNTVLAVSTLKKIMNLLSKTWKKILNVTFSFRFFESDVSSIEPLSWFPVFASGLAVLILPFLVCHSLLFTCSIKCDSSQHSAGQSSY